MYVIKFWSHGKNYEKVVLMFFNFLCVWCEDHPWIQKKDVGPNVYLGDHVRMRIKQFSLMNKFKKKVLRV